MAGYQVFDDKNEIITNNNPHLYYLCSMFSLLYLVSVMIIVYDVKHFLLHHHYSPVILRESQERWPLCDIGCIILSSENVNHAEIVP